jgi:VCBS repeat-containing protein
MAETKQVNAGTKLESIGTVKTVVGEVKAVDAAGNERILQAGDKVFANETIVTANGGMVMIEFADGTHLDLASASKIVLDTDVFNPATAAAAPEGKELTAEQIQEMIARGEDPTAVTEASAAGAGAGDEGGSSFIVVDFNNTQGNVTSGFNTLGIPGPESTTFTELPPVEDDAVPAAPVVTVVVVVTPETPNEENPLPPPVVTANGVSLVEGTMPGNEEVPAGTRPVTFNFVLDKAFTSDVTVTFTVAGSGANPAVVGTAPGENVDVIDNTTHTVVIPAGSTVIPVTLFIVGDADVEDNETFTITITSATNATVGAANSVVVTIIDDDSQVTALPDTNWVQEDNFGGEEGPDHTVATGNVLNTVDHSAGAPNEGTFGDNADTQIGVPGALTTSLVGDGSGTYGSLVMGSDGSYTYTLNNEAANVQALAAGQAVTETFTYTVTDGNDTKTATLTITIFGTNDTPTITGDVRGAVIEAGNEDPGIAIGGTTSTNPGAATPGTPSATGTLTATDPDQGATAAWSGNAAGTYGNFAINPATGVWTYTLDNSKAATNALAEGATATETFTVTVTDDKGATATQNVTITITGANDSPVISFVAGNDAGSVKEDTTTSVTGQLSSSDVDTGATAAWSISPNSPTTSSPYGTFSVDNTGKWTYNLNNGSAAVQALAQGQTVTETYTVRVLDDKGAWDDQQVTVTINGTNDTPTITGDTAGAVVEAGNVDPGTAIGGTTSTNPGAATPGTPSATGTLTATDPDQGATASWSGNAAGTYGNFAINPATGVWTYTLDNSKAATNALAEGATATETFTVTVTDDKGATATQNVTITITGANDSPVISGVATGSVTEDTTTSVSGQLSATDVDTGATAAWSISPNSPTASSPYGTFSLDSTGKWTYVLNNASAAVQGLAAGETVTEKYTVRVTDDKGAWDDQEVVVTINGTNDTPTITTDSGNPQGANDVVYEAGLAAGTGVGPTTTLVGGTFTLSDPDGLDDIQSVTINGTTIAIGNLGNNNAIVGPNGTLTVTGYNAATGVATYTYQLTSPAADVAGTETNVFTLTTSDGTTSSAPATITIEIADDVPLFNLVNDGSDAGTAVTIDVLNPATDATYNAQFADWKLGADGFNSATVNAPSNVTVLSQSATQIVLGLTENGVQVATLTLNADGTDSLQVEHRDGAVVFTPVAATSAVAGGPTGSLIVDLGAAADFNILVRGSDGDNTPNEADDAVNTSTNGWAVKGQQGQTIQQNESITFSFVDDGNVNTAFPVDDFRFKAEGYTGGITSATITVKVYLDASLTTYDQMTFDVTSGQVIQVGSLNWSANAGNGDYVPGAPIYGVQVISAEPDGSFRLNGVEVGANSDLPPNDLSFENISVTIKDGDGDTATQVFNVHIDGSTGNQITVEAIAGTSGADTLNGTAGNDILIGGAGDDLLAGGAGSDTFVWKAGESGTDTVTGFTKGVGGDVLNLADLLQGETAANIETGGFLQSVSYNGGNTTLVFDTNGSAGGGATQTIVIQGVDLTNGGALSTPQAVLHQLLQDGNLKVDS